MSYSFWFVCILSCQCIRRNWYLWKNVGYAFGKIYSLQKGYEIAQLDVIRISLLKPSDGEHTYPGLLGDLFLGHSRSNPIFPEPLAQRLDNLHRGHSLNIHSFYHFAAKVHKLSLKTEYLG